MINITIICLVVYYLVYWPEEECVSVVMEKMILLDERYEVGDSCKVKNQRDVWHGIVAGIGKDN